MGGRAHEDRRDDGGIVARGCRGALELKRATAWRADAAAALAVVGVLPAVLAVPAFGAEPRAAVDSRVAAEPAAWRWHLPRGFPPPYVPPDNPMSSVKVALGRRLFFEPRLSVTGAYHCGSCHDPALAYTDGRATAIGATGADVGRATLSLANVAYLPSYGWFDPGVATLEAQLRVPLYNEHPIELGLAGREPEVRAMLAADANYAAAFARAFPHEREPVTIDNMIRAIAAFERTLISGDSAFDRYAFGGRHDALDDAAKRGMELFYSARLGCGECHAGFAFTGSTRDASRPDARPAFAADASGARRVRVPTLRNVAVTAPYMHDGRYATLEDVIAHYERSGAIPAIPAVTAGETGPRLRRFELTPGERRDLVAFLRSLTDEGFLAPAAAD